MEKGGDLLSLLMSIGSFFLPPPSVKLLKGYVDSESYRR